MSTTNAQRTWQAVRRMEKASERWAQRQARIDARPVIPPMDRAWAAGHFEGEGTVTLTKAGRIMHVRPLVSLASTDRSCRDFFNDRWPGNCCSRSPRSEREREAFIWALNSGERIQIFLLDILPFIKTNRVRQKIEVLLDDIRDRGLYQQQIEIRGRSEQRRILMRQLNAKGAETLIVEGDIRLFLPIGSTGQLMPLLEGPKP